MLNMMCLHGRLVRDPELRRTQSGKAVTSFTVAWSEKYGESETQLFLDCTVWNATAEMMERNFRKGDPILVEGRLQTRKWQDKDGNNRSTTEMLVSRVHFVGQKRDAGQNPDAAPTYPTELEPLDGDDADIPF